MSNKTTCSTAWLDDNSGNVKILDGSFYLPAENRDADAEFADAHITGARRFNIDVIWLMVLMLITMEISLLTPPFGLLLYVMKGVAQFEVTLGQVIRSALPFIVIELFVLALLVWIPELATWLPSKID